MANALIRLEGIRKVFEGDEIQTYALDGIHLTIDYGEYVAIEGPSGCGKSTLLSILGLLDTSTEGKYWLNDRPVESLSVVERARTPEELRAALRRAFARRDGPTLIDVPVGPFPSPWPFIFMPPARGQ